MGIAVIEDKYKQHLYFVKGERIVLQVVIVNISEAYGRWMWIDLDWSELSVWSWACLVTWG